MLFITNSLLGVFSINGQDELESFGAELLSTEVEPRTINANENQIKIGEFRIWTSKEDTKIEAKLLRIENGKIIVELKDRREYAIPILLLNEYDRIQVEKFQVDEFEASLIDFEVFRLWTSLDGRKIEAKICDATDIGVEIELSDRRTFRLPLEKLSQTDKKYVSKFLLQKGKLTDDQILKRLAMYDWKDTRSGKWNFRLEFSNEKLSSKNRKLKWIESSGTVKNGSWYLRPNGLVHTSFGRWRFPTTDKKDKVLIPDHRGIRSLYGSTSL